MTKTIYVEQIPNSGPHGDRATTNTNYFDYAIHVIEETEDAKVLCEETRVHVIEGYDHWRSSVHSQRRVKEKAREYAQNLGEKLNLPVRWGDDHLKLFEFRTEPVRIYAASLEEATEVFKDKLKDGAAGDSIAIRGGAL